MAEVTWQGKERPAPAGMLTDLDAAQQAVDAGYERLKQHRAKGKGK